METVALTSVAVSHVISARPQGLRQLERHSLFSFKLCLVALQLELKTQVDPLACRHAGRLRPATLRAVLAAQNYCSDGPAPARHADQASRSGRQQPGILAIYRQGRRQARELGRRRAGGRCSPQLTAWYGRVSPLVRNFLLVSDFVLSSGTEDCGVISTDLNTTSSQYVIKNTIDRAFIRRRCRGARTNTWIPHCQPICLRAAVGSWQREPATPGAGAACAAAGA